MSTNQQDHPRVIVVVHGGCISAVRASHEVTISVIDNDNYDMTNHQSIIELEAEFEALPHAVYP